MYRNLRGGSRLKSLPIVSALATIFAISSTSLRVILIGNWSSKFWTIGDLGDLEDLASTYTCSPTSIIGTCEGKHKIALSAFTIHFAWNLTSLSLCIITSPSNDDGRFVFSLAPSLSPFDILRTCFSYLMLILFSSTRWLPPHVGYIFKWPGPFHALHSQNILW